MRGVDKISINTNLFPRHTPETRNAFQVPLSLFKIKKNLRSEYYSLNVQNLNSPSLEILFIRISERGPTT